MNNDEQRKVIDRVRKMLRLSENEGATEGERDNALRMAHATLAKYNLDMAQVGSLETKESENRVGEQREKQDEKFYGRPWARQVCNSVAKLFFCYYFYTGNGRMVKHTFIGRHSNAVTARELSRYLVESIYREAKRFQAERMGGSTDKRSFATGAAHKIFERCKKLREEAEKPATSAPGTALVLASLYKKELQLNTDYMKDLGIRLGTGRGSSTNGIGLDAYSAGAAYGASVSLDRQVGRSTSSTKLIK